MSTRESTNAVIDQWAEGRGIDPEDLRKLKRDIAVVASTPQLIMRQDSRIKMEVAKCQQLIERRGAVKGSNMWLEKVPMPYWMQKCVQWFVAEAYSEGMKHGKQDRSNQAR